MPLFFLLLSAAAGGLDGWINGWVLACRRLRRRFFSFVSSVFASIWIYLSFICQVRPPMDHLKNPHHVFCFLHVRTYTNTCGEERERQAPLLFSPPSVVAVRMVSLQASKR